MVRRLPNQRPGARPADRTRRHSVAALLVASALGGLAPPADAQEGPAPLRRQPFPQPLPPEARESLFFLPDFYLEAGVSVLGLELTRPTGALGDTSSDRVAGTLRAGLAFTDTFALEIDANVLETDTAFVAPVADGSAQFAVAEDPDQLAAALLRVSYPFTARLAAHGRVGFGAFNSEVPSSGVDDDRGAAFGAGLRYQLVGPTGLRADYTRYEFSDVAADAVTLVVSFEF